MAATFGNRESAPVASKIGDYILRVIGLDKGISTGAKTSGCTKYEFRCLVEKRADGEGGSQLNDIHIFSDNEFFAAKLDCFLKSCGVNIKEGESFDFDEADAAEETQKTGKRCVYINPIGLRGWATIGMKKPQNAGDAAKWNEVTVWLTTKEKLPRHVVPVQVPAAEQPDWN